MIQKVLLLCFLILSCAIPIESKLPLHSLQQTSYSRLSKEPLSELGPFSFIQFLGEGDQARVYKALNEYEQPVAVKVFYTKSEMQEVHPERKKTIDLFFEADGSSKAANAEYEVGIKLNHPNIITLYHRQESLSQEGEKVLSLVLEYVQGKNLDKVKPGSLAKETSLRLASQLLQALSYAFSQGLIHNDLWSENIFIDHENNLKLIDLGSFDPLPPLADKKKSKYTYMQYFQVIRKNLLYIFKLSDFTEKEVAKMIKMVDEAAKSGENCHIAQEFQTTLAANLLKLIRHLA
jgi:serine/threonine protein kinase